MSEQVTNQAELQIIRERAKEMGIKNYAQKGYDKLYKEVMAEIDRRNEIEAEKTKATKEAALLKRRDEEKTKKAMKDLQFEGFEKYYFTNPRTGKIGEYIHLDKKNMTKHNEKGTAFKFLRWM